MGTTQAAVVQYALEPLSVELREIPVPEIGEHDVLLQVGAVSVCGSDVHQFHATHSWAVNVPVVLGHEFCGTVARAGRSVRGVKEVMNRLEPHDSSEGIPSLRGGRRIGRGVRISPGLQLVAGVLGATAVALGAGRIAARVRASRHDTLEREMPEYAMLR